MRGEGRENQLHCQMELLRSDGMCEQLMTTLQETVQRETKIAISTALLGVSKV